MAREFGYDYVCCCFEFLVDSCCFEQEQEQPSQPSQAPQALLQQAHNVLVKTDVFEKWLIIHCKTDVFEESYVSV